MLTKVSPAEKLRAWKFVNGNLALDFFCCNILFHMQEFLNLLFLSHEKVLLPGLKVQTLDYKHYFLSTRPTVISEVTKSQRNRRRQGILQIFKKSLHSKLVKLM